MQKYNHFVGFKITFFMFINATLPREKNWIKNK